MNSINELKESLRDLSKIKQIKIFIPEGKERMRMRENGEGKGSLFIETVAKKLQVWGRKCTFRPREPKEPRLR